jgi:hypothetical protein
VVQVTAVQLLMLVQLEQARSLPEVQAVLW